MRKLILLPFVMLFVIFAYSFFLANAETIMNSAAAQASSSAESGTEQKVGVSDSVTISVMRPYFGIYLPLYINGKNFDLMHKAFFALLISLIPLFIWWDKASRSIKTTTIPQQLSESEAMWKRIAEVSNDG